MGDDCEWIFRSDDCWTFEGIGDTKLEDGRLVGFGVSRVVGVVTDWLILEGVVTDWLILEGEEIDWLILEGEEIDWLILVGVVTDWFILPPCGFVDLFKWDTVEVVRVDFIDVLTGVVGVWIEGFVGVEDNLPVWVTGGRDDRTGFEESDCLGVIEDEEIDDNVDETALIEETGSLGCDKEELFLVTFAFIRAEVNTVVFLGWGTTVEGLWLSDIRGYELRMIFVLNRGLITFRGGVGAIRESSDIIIDPSSLLQTGDWRFWTDVFTTVPLDKKEESLSSIEESESRSELAVDNREISVGKKCCLIVWTSSFSCCDKTCEAVNDRYWWSEIPVNVIVEL